MNQITTKVQLAVHLMPLYAGRGLGEMKLNKPGWQKFEMLTSWQQAGHVKLYSYLLQLKRREPLIGPSYQEGGHCTCVCDTLLRVGGDGN